MVNPSIPFQFGGTSLLIIVVGVMDFVAQTQSHLMSHQYEGLMKKASLRGIVALCSRWGLLWRGAATMRPFLRG